MLIQKKAVREFALECARSRHHKFTRVSEEFYIKCEALLKTFIAEQVKAKPSKGQTI